MKLYLEQKSNPDVYEVYLKKKIKYEEAPGVEFEGGRLVGHLFVNLNDTLPESFYEGFCFIEKDLLKMEDLVIDLRQLVKNTIKNSKDAYLILRGIDSVGKSDLFFEL